MKVKARKPLRVWPAVVIGIAQLLVMFALPFIAPEAAIFGVLGGVIGGLAIVAWWMFLSRAPWTERLGALVLMIVSLFATTRILHVSVAKAGQGMLFPVMAIPFLGLAFVAWALATRRLSDRSRRATMIATVVLASGGWALVRTGGVTGTFQSELHWRWTKTPEERLLAQSRSERSGNERAALAPAQPAAAETPEKRPVPKPGDKPAALPPTSAGKAPAEAETGAGWPGFRGPHRDDIIPGMRIKTDWTTSPPVALWRRPIGPGWSSFAARGGLFYTQEQRGPDEIVACYKLSTGEPVWAHRDAARFWESNGGAGPRATPTLSNGRVYTMGATGILNALDARDGAVVWSHNAAADAGTEVPIWGLTSSPLVVDDIVIVYAGKLAAYDIVTGHPRWFGPAGGVSYSSPQLLTIGGVAQVLMLGGANATSVAPADGTLLWQYPWGPSIVQPAQTADGDLLISAMDASGGIGTRRIAVTHGPSGWNVQERWTSKGLKPYFNDFVAHNGHAFGFDNSILSCIDLKDGTRKWKGGRYGNGQLVLLPDQDLLLVLSEEGELALVRATPDQFMELARFPAIEGKTWNHPVLAGDVLLVRNGQEMAAFRLSLAGR